MPSTGTGWHRLDDGVGRYRTSVDVGVVHADGEAVLVDCDDASVVESLRRERGLDVAAAAFTHYHRDIAGGARALAEAGVDVVVPAAERAYFEAPDEFWSDPEFRWHRYDFRPHSLLPTRPVSVDRAVEPGERYRRGGVELEVLATPGHTESGVSYAVEVGGARYAFCGDALHGDGKLVDAHSLQRGHGELHDYHGFLGDRDRYLDGLDALADADVLVPARGGPIRRPAEAVARVGERLEACHRRYVRTSALRYYFPDLFERARDEDTMQMRATKARPSWVRQVGTTWVLRSARGEALVMDCGAPAVLERLAAWRDEGEIGEVTAFWETHYHDDHVGEVPAFREAYDVPVSTQRRVAAVVENPDAYRLPCMSPHRIPVDRSLSDGERWEWNEWTLTARWFPGQTLYHAALLAEGHGVRLLFAGDAFTPAGMDDYCTRNRNPLSAGRGYRRCLRTLSELDPTHVFNCHVEQPFAFTPEQVRFMRANLKERERLFDDLLAWDHPDFGLDPRWVRCFPYAQSVAPGERAAVEVRATNYASRDHALAVRPELPAEWEWSAGGDAGERDGERWASTGVAAGETGAVDLSLRAPPDVDADPVVVPVSVRWNGRTFRRFREALLWTGERR